MALLGAVFATSSAWAMELQPPESPFQAKMAIRSGEGVEMSGSLWYDGGKERREMTVDGEDIVLITRPDRGSVYMVSPVNLMAMQMSLKPEMRYYSEESLAGLDAEALGEETVSGEATTKYRVDSNASAATVVGGFLWITPDNIAMKFEGTMGTDRVSMVLADVTRGPVEATMFEVPNDYNITKVD
jgi:hypothetical protein